MVTRAPGAWNWKTPLGQRSGPFGRWGLECGGDGGVGPTLVPYLCGVGAGAAGTIEATTAVVAAGMAEALWLAAAMAVGAEVEATMGGGEAAATATVGATATVVGSGPGLDPPAGGGEERCTEGLKLCPPRVLTMPGLEKGRRWREWEEEDFFAKEEKGFEMKMKSGGRGGGVGLNRWVRVGERFSPLNVQKWVLNLGLKKMENLMYCAGNERFQKTKREEGEQ